MSKYLKYTAKINQKSHSLAVAMDNTLTGYGFCILNKFAAKNRRNSAKAAFSAIILGLLQPKRGKIYPF